MKSVVIGGADFFTFFIFIYKEGKKYEMSNMQKGVSFYNTKS